MDNAQSHAWTRRDLTGLGMVTIADTTDGHRIHGAEVAGDGDAFWSVRFDLDVDDSWTTVSMDTEVVRDGEMKRMLLERDPDATWRIDGVSAPDLDGCTDVDITSTPFTNTLPIRRLDLSVGDTHVIKAAWLEVPEMAVRPMDQRYTRLPPEAGHDRYEYQSLPSGSTYVLIVDSDGIVIDYERLAVLVWPAADDGKA
jgi:uncharacterized protein